MGAKLVFLFLGCPKLKGLIQMMASLLQFDRYLFSLINGQWNHAFLDWLMPWLRNSTLWVPLYLFLFLYAAINYKANGLRFIAIGIVAVAIGDLISSSVIKQQIIRLRPCNEPTLADSVRVLVAYRPQSSSFTSSHAVNHFALAAYLFQTLKKPIGKWMWIGFGWAFSIIYAQVYVGVHYPLDVVCGAIIGILIGYLHGQLFNKRYQLA